MTSGRGSELRQQEAADWMARMRGEDAEHHRGAFETWRSDPANAHTYARLEKIWEGTGVGIWTPTGKARTLRYEKPVKMLLRGAVAATLVLVLIGVIAALAVSGAIPGNPARQIMLANGVSGIRTVRLEDGSVVTLDGKTKIAVLFSRTERIVTLITGRARFDVAHESNRPFMVAAAGREVVARGTIFDVAASQDGLAITLIRGAVDVKETARSDTPRTIAQLKPGQSFSERKANAPTVFRSVEANLQWVKGRLNYKDAPLRDVLADANRYSTHEIRIANAQLGQIKVTGSFVAQDGRQLAPKLARALTLSMRSDPDGGMTLMPTSY